MQGASPLRKFARAAIIGGAVLAPFAGATAAQAAIAGANPGTATTRPNLLSINRVSGTQVEYCFSKALDNEATPAGGSFSLGGYAAGAGAMGGGAVNGFPIVGQSAQVDPANTSCVLVSFGTTFDYDNYSIGQVAAGAVATDADDLTNPTADSSALLGASGVSGTQGHTTAPDLIGVTVDTDNDRATFEFDQAINPAGADAADYSLYDSTGNATETGTDIDDSDVAAGTVTVDFDSVADAVRGEVTGGDLTSATGNGQSNPAAGADIPGAGTVEGIPTLATATVRAGTATVDYTFNAPESGANIQPDGGAFTAYTSDGTAVTSTSAQALGNNTVRVTFTNAQQTDEEYVRVGVAADAVTDTVSDTANLEDGIQTGGNAGAKAAGYTNAPDAQSVAFDTSSGDATITFDQRVSNTVNGNSFELLGANGTPITGATTTVRPVSSGPNPGPTTVTVNFDRGSLSQARSIAILGNQRTNTIAPAVQTFAGGGTGNGGAPGNVTQVLSPTASSVRAYAKPKFSKIHAAARRKLIRAEAKKTLR